MLRLHNVSLAKGSPNPSDPSRRVAQADAAGDANAQIAALERLHAALLARDEVVGRIAALDQVHVDGRLQCPGMEAKPRLLS